MESNAARRPGRSLLTSLGVLVTLAIVAVASRGGTSSGEPEAPRLTDALLDIFFTIYLILLVAGGIFYIYLLVIHRRMKRRGTPGAGGRLSLLVLAILLLVGLAMARRLHGFELRPPPEVRLVPEEQEPLPGTTTPSAEVMPYEAGFAWIPVLVLVGLLGLGVGALWWSSRRRRAGTGGEPPTLGEALADVLDETLDALRAERDPRRAVIAAYARLERVLAAHGLARRPADAPLEYLARVLSDLSVSANAVQRLTLLFERAKFSHHEVGEQMKEEAIEALVTVQDELRAAEALAQQERDNRALELARSAR